MPPRIEGLFWTEEAERHVEEHINAWEIGELIEGGDYYRFSNRSGHRPNRWRFIGRIPGGIFVTAVLEEPGDGDPTKWQPVTGWRSDSYERKMYEQEQKRDATKRGKRHG